MSFPACMAFTEDGRKIPHMGWNSAIPRTPLMRCGTFSAARPTSTSCTPISTSAPTRPSWRCARVWRELRQCGPLGCRGRHAVPTRRRASRRACAARELLGARVPAEFDWRFGPWIPVPAGLRNQPGVAAEGLPRGEYSMFNAKGVAEGAANSGMNTNTVAWTSSPQPR